MSGLTATVQEAAQWVREDSTSPPTLNPVYRALLEDAVPVPTEPPAGDDADLVRRQLTAPALLVVAVTAGGRTRRLRIGLDPAGASVERSAADDPSQWTGTAVHEVPELVTTLLEESGVDLGAPSRDRPAGPLRPTAEQNRAVRSALARGLTPEAAFASLPDLDDSLRDALTASGPRLSLSLTLADPQRRVAPEPVSWSRLWVTGQEGLYRTDPPDRSGPTVRAVSGGDVLGTLPPILEQGLRFTAACGAVGGAR